MSTGTHWITGYSRVAMKDCPPSFFFLLSFGTWSDLSCCSGLSTFPFFLSYFLSYSHSFSHIFSYNHFDFVSRPLSIRRDTQYSYFVFYHVFILVESCSYVFFQIIVMILIPMNLIYIFSSIILHMPTQYPSSNSSGKFVCMRSSKINAGRTILFSKSHTLIPT